MSNALHGKMTTPLLSEDILNVHLNIYMSRLAKVLKMFRIAIFKGPMKNAKCVEPYSFISSSYFAEFSINKKCKQGYMYNIMFIQ